MARTHGKPSTYNHGCRCPKCRDGWRVYQAKLQAQRVAKLPTNTTVVHGRSSTYTNYGCRCESCTDAHSERTWQGRIAKSREWLANQQRLSTSD